MAQEEEREILYKIFIRGLKECGYYNLFVKNYNTLPFFYYEGNKSQKISLKEWFENVRLGRIPSLLNDVFRWPIDEANIWLGIHYSWDAHVRCKPFDYTDFPNRIKSHF